MAIFSTKTDRKYGVKNIDKVTIHGIVATAKIHFIVAVKFQGMIEKFMK